jgi:uncharacterized oxidoreductase
MNPTQNLAQKAFHGYSADRLREFAASIFAAVGSSREDASVVADSLVAANLVGHDSHGIMRIPEYVGWVEQGRVNLSPHARVTQSTESFAVYDGDWGWGQVIGRNVVDLLTEKTSDIGVATVFCHNSCHIGRVGEYAEILARRGYASVMFVNTHGAGRLVAPWGGIERRLSANPIAIGIPREESDPIVVDISTCALAEGKLRNIMTAGQPVPAGCIIDAAGHPSTNAADFYGPPAGALLPFGGHKGFALALAADVLAGALSGAGCSRPDADRVGNSFLITAIDVQQVRGRSEFEQDVSGLIDFVKSSHLAEGCNEILVPGEPEARIRQQRNKEGIPINPVTWKVLLEIVARYGIAISANDHLD